MWRQAAVRGEERKEGSGKKRKKKRNTSLCPCFQGQKLFLFLAGGKREKRIKNLEEILDEVDEQKRKRKK